MEHNFTDYKDYDIGITILNNDAKYSMTFNFVFPIAAMISVTKVDSRFNILSLHCKYLHNCIKRHGFLMSMFISLYYYLS